jgi:hypothetical protein
MRWCDEQERLKAQGLKPDQEADVATTARRAARRWFYGASNA